MFDLLPNDVTRQAEVRNAVTQHTAQLVQCFKDGYPITLRSKVVRRNERRRTAAGQRHAISAITDALRGRREILVLPRSPGCPSLCWRNGHLSMSDASDGPGCSNLK